MMQVMRMHASGLFGRVTTRSVGLPIALLFSGSLFISSHLARTHCLDWIIFLAIDRCLRDCYCCCYCPCIETLIQVNYVKKFGLIFFLLFIKMI